MYESALREDRSRCRARLYPQSKPGSRIRTHRQRIDRQGPGDACQAHGRSRKLMSRQKKMFIERLGNEVRYRRPSGPLWQSAVDIYRCPEGSKIKFDLAGVKPEDVQVL